MSAVNRDRLPPDILASQTNKQPQFGPAESRVLQLRKPLSRLHDPDDKWNKTIDSCVKEELRMTLCKSDVTLHFKSFKRELLGVIEFHRDDNLRVSDHYCDYYKKYIDYCQDWAPQIQFQYFLLHINLHSWGWKVLSIVTALLLFIDEIGIRECN